MKITFSTNLQSTPFLLKPDWSSIPSDEETLEPIFNVFPSDYSKISVKP